MYLIHYGINMLLKSNTVKNMNQGIHFLTVFCNDKKCISLNFISSTEAFANINGKYINCVIFDTISRGNFIS